MKTKLVNVLYDSVISDSVGEKVVRAISDFNQIEDEVHIECKFKVNMILDYKDLSRARKSLMNGDMLIALVPSKGFREEFHWEGLSNYIRYFSDEKISRGFHSNILILKEKTIENLLVDKGLEQFFAYKSGHAVLREYLNIENVKTVVTGYLEENTNFHDLNRSYGVEHQLETKLGLLSLIVDRGSAPDDVVADLLSDFSLLYELSDGSGINFVNEKDHRNLGVRV